MKRICSERSIIALLVLLVAFGTISCLEDNGMEDSAYYDLGIFHTFNNDFAGWEAGLSDIPVDTLDDMEFEVARDTIDEITGKDNNSIRITSNNPHKDAFVYLAKQIDSLPPNTKYEVGLIVELKIELEQDTSGQFDPDLFLKAGASLTEPDTLLVNEDSELGYIGYALNLDKGNNDVDGSDIKTVSSLKVPVDRDTPRLGSVQGSTDLNLNITTDSNGKFWMIVGIDSALPFKMSFYFNSIDIYLKEL